MKTTKTSKWMAALALVVSVVAGDWAGVSNAINSLYAARK